MGQKLATQHGGCLALVSFWKNALASYHDNGKVLEILGGKSNNAVFYLYRRSTGKLVI